MKALLFCSGQFDARLGVFSCCGKPKPLDSKLDLLNEYWIDWTNDESSVMSRSLPNTEQASTFRQALLSLLAIAISTRSPASKRWTLDEMWALTGHIWPVTLLQCALHYAATGTKRLLPLLFLCSFRKGRARWPGQSRIPLVWIGTNVYGDLFFSFLFACWTLWTSPEQQAFSVPSLLSQYGAPAGLWTIILTPKRLYIYIWNLISCLNASQSVSSLFLQVYKRMWIKKNGFCLPTKGMYILKRTTRVFLTYKFIINVCVTLD